VNLEEVLLLAVHEDPSDDMPWLVLADWFEETGEVSQAELIRLQRSLRGTLPEADRQDREERLWRLLAEGVRPVVPTVVNAIGMHLALLPRGVFWMGSLAEEEKRNQDEGPRHQVEIGKAFHLGVFQVTQGEYERVMGNNPSYFCRANGWQTLEEIDTTRLPVENVSWNDAVEFCARLSRLPEELTAGRVYRLPTEAEWEYACRGGAASKAPFHCGWSLSPGQANFDGNYPCNASRGRYLERPATVGSYRPNAFGLYDMHGNVWEWCSDCFDPSYYDRSPHSDPQGPEAGSARVQRGGSWYSYGWACRSGQRCHLLASDRNNRSGLRVAMDLVGSSSHLLAGPVSSTPAT
jgi:uncharacterized protein (TIGR02996 family)